MPDRPLVLGHRGAPFEAPENTLRGFRIARAHGADGIELDVQPAADGAPVVIHDPTLDRTTSGTGPVASRPWSELRTASVGGEPLARLEDAMAWAAEADAWVNVEIKSPGVEAASVRAVREAGWMERTVFSSFVPSVLETLRSVAPDATRYLLTERWDDEVRATAWSLAVDGICPHHTLATADLLAELGDAGLGVVVWTVDDPARMRELLRAGVTAVITNRPEEGVAALREVAGAEG